MRIRDLYDRHTGTIYIIGTGPSLRVFDLGFLIGQTTIGLNQAYKYIATTYNITVHPELLTEYEQSHPQPDSAVWLVKHKAPRLDLELDHPKHYVFHTAEDWDLFEHPRRDTLFIGRGVQQTAMDMAARMGAKNIVLVGVDMTALGGDHHGHVQHVQYHGLASDSVFCEYRLWTRRARTELRKRNISVFTLSPFVGLGDANHDYEHLKAELGLDKLPSPKDVSKYTRSGIDVPE
jgi:hypothetical protein